MWEHRDTLPCNLCDGEPMFFEVAGQEPEFVVICPSCRNWRRGETEMEAVDAWNGGSAYRIGNEQAFAALEGVI